MAAVAMAKETNGFRPATEIKAHPRLVMAVDGGEKSGKTRFALTTPAPIYYINLDVGLEGVIDEFIGNKEIVVAEYAENVEEIGDIPTQDGKKRQDAAKVVTNSVFRDFRYAVRNGARTVVIDTGTEFWSMLRLAEF